MIRGSSLLILALSVAAPAQRRPVPSADQLDRARTRGLQAMTDVLVDEAGAPDEAITLLAEAALRVEDDPAVSFLLLDQALRCARRLARVDRGLHVVDLMARRFEVDDFERRMKFLASVEAAESVPRAALVEAYVGVADASAEAPDDRRMSRALERARALAGTTGVEALVDHADRSARDLAARHAAWSRIDGDAARGRYLCYYRGAWAEGLPLLAAAEELETARVVENKLEGEGSGIDFVGFGQAWLAHAAKIGAEPIVLRNLRLRARYWFHRAYPLLEGLERRRLVRMLDQLDGRLAADACFGQQCFTTPESRDDVLIEGGEWRVEDGLLIGRNTGRSTHSTLPFAFRTIDAVEIRAGIRSVDNLNLRLAVGDLNVLFNWEAAPENLYFIGDHRTATRPHALTRGKEHEIRVRQMGRDIVVFLDGAEVFRGPGRLSGTVSVYPALGSEIFVRRVQVEGRLDPYAVVDGPTTELR